MPFIRFMRSLTVLAHRTRAFAPRRARVPAVLACLFALSACSNLEFPWVYRIDIDQGNIITQDMVNKLKPGMTRDQVKFVMGSPLVIDPFHTDRWDYVYTLRKGKSKVTTEKRLTVFFKDDKLASMRGDFLPQATQPQPAGDAAPASPTGVN